MTMHEASGFVRMYASMIIRFKQQAQHVRAFYEYKAGM